MPLSVGYQYLNDKVLSVNEKLCSSHQHRWLRMMLNVMVLNMVYDMGLMHSKAWLLCEWVSE